MTLLLQPYGDLIRQNTISQFDFQVYLFAKQSSLLFLQQLPVEVARRGFAFVQSMCKQLQANEKALRPNFAETWMFTVCTRLVQRCDDCIASGGLMMDDTMAGYRGSLLFMARRQLDKLGIRLGLLPSVFPFVSTGPQTSAIEQLEALLAKDGSEAADDDGGVSSSTSMVTKKKKSTNSIFIPVLLLLLLDAGSL